MTSIGDSTVDQVRLQQLDHWQNSRRVLVEQLLEEHPALTTDKEAVLELIGAELLLREEAGESPTIEEYRSRFPAIAEEVGRLVAVHQMLERLANPAAQSTSVFDQTLDHRQKEYSFQTVISNPSDGDSPIVPPDEPFPEIEGYEIVRELGKGGMGIVYCALHRSLKRMVALKVIRDHTLIDPTNLQRFRTEAKAVARLQHPNIVQIYDFGEHLNTPYFSLEFLPEGSLDSRLQGEPQPIRESVALVATLARAIGFAHRHDIVHRDLKPANILLAPRAELCQSGTVLPNNGRPLNLADLVPKVTDFGLAKSLGDDSNLTRTEAIVGTPAYMSPEQAWGRSRDVGPATDVHALGLILYELLTGVVPFRDPSFARVLDKIRFSEVDSPSRHRREIPPQLDAICSRCLQKEPAQRYPTADALAEDLERFSEGKRISIASPRRSRRPLLAAFLVLTGIGIAFGIFVSKRRSASEMHTNTGISPPSPASSEKTSSPVVASFVPKRTTGDKFAFLAGVRSYRLPRGPIDLEFTEADVDEMSRTLLKRGFARKNIRLLTQWSEADNPKLAPTGKNIREQLRAMLSNCIADDTVLVAVTGMGSDLDSEDMYYYLPADAQPEQEQSLISLHEFYDLFRGCPAKMKLLLVDTCQSTSVGDFKWKSVPPAPPGLAVIFACSPHEGSFEHSSLRHGVFSYHVMRALEGAADKNHDNTISLDELFQFAKSGVNDFLKKEFPGSEQTPRMVTSLPGSTPVVSLSAATSPK